MNRLLETNLEEDREIDVLVRPLVSLMNDLPGITTTASCSGHDGEDGYVMFKAASQENLISLAELLPPLGVRGGYRENRPWSAHIAIRLGCIADEWQYTLTFGGTPSWAQRECLEEIERTLKDAVRPLPAKQ